MARANKKAQSALEYLATYGWAILIIAVVLAALYQLGLFSKSTSNTALPGSCQVLRPGGPLSKFNMQLAGLCNGQPTQYVGVFNGQNSYAQLPNDVLDSYVINGHPFSISVWFYPQTCQPSNSWGQFFSWEPANNNPREDFDFYWFTSSSSCSGERVSTEWYQGGSGGPGVSYSPSSSLKGTWHFALITYSGSPSNTMTLYLDGALVSSGGGGVWTYSPPTPVYYGLSQCSGCAGSDFPGMLANIQFYNASLSMPEANALYIEGIGGAPLVLQNLVGWWPLNGNTNDYSGDNLTGSNNGVTFTSSWTSGYTAP